MNLQRRTVSAQASSVEGTPPAPSSAPPRHSTRTLPSPPPHPPPHSPPPPQPRAPPLRPTLHPRPALTPPVPSLAPHQLPPRTSNVNYSHFISLPLAIHPELVDKLFSFQNSILGNVDVSVDESPGSSSGKSRSLSDLGIDESIFINPKTFHLTVLMLELWRMDRAASVLQSISKKVKDALGNRPVSVRLKGLECMKGSLAECRVLYAAVEEVGSEDRLSRACQVIIDSFFEAGLVLEKDAKRKLRLHVTVMNTSHRRGNSLRRNNTFDARDIVKRYENEVWGEVLICEAHLSQRFKYDDNGYYHCCASIPFPKSADRLIHK